MSPTKRRGLGRRGHGRGRGATAEKDMDHLDISVPSSPSTTSDREDQPLLIPRQSPACYVGPSEVSTMLLNPKINHRSDAIFGDQAVEQLKLRHHKPLKFHERYRPYLRDAEEVDDMTVERHVRAYILSLLCGVLFPDGTGRMSLIYLPLIADLSRVSTYSWASAVLAFLYRSLCSVASSHNIKNIGGSLLLLQLWSWERFHVGRPLVRSPLCTEMGIEHDLPPIGFRWVGSRTQSESANRCLKQYRDELNVQRVDQVKWEPYLQVESSTLPPLCTRDADLWLTQAPLINFPIVEMYLPERVMRQFGLRQCIPPPFRPTLQSLHRISRRGKERENWEETHHEYIQEWEARRQRIFRDTEQYDPSSYEEYLRWYSGATRRYLVPATSDDGEAGPSAPTDDFSDLQYQAKSPIIRKAVDKLESMVKKAKRAMTTTADTTTQALVAEFLLGFEDVLQDLGEIQNNSGSTVPPFHLDSPHFDAAASQQTPQLLLEAEENLGTNQEAQLEEDEELNTVERASLALETVEEENDFSNDVLPGNLSLGVEEDCDSATPANGICDAATPMTDLVVPRSDEGLHQDQHLEDHTEIEPATLMVEPKCEEGDGSSFVLPPSPPELMLEEQDDSGLIALGTGSCTEQQSLGVGEAEDQENPRTGTAQHGIMIVERTGEENSSCNGVYSSCPPSSVIVESSSDYLC
ncbi:Aminotransferase-like plant mobile domain family protein [Zea mays]|uniref:Aminotransferase-like plant mobile domain family protein n=1 Tax=Zea mays TaxID=4577 RepID=A0A1D6NSF7_MAIZE|nr:Aminotransferase-like plant mobile domain family protein [Zea mays]